MSVRGKWKATPLGRLALFIGGVRFAVIALTLAAVAMIWGTWIDSTQGAEQAFRKVYAAWWFVALMAFICASLILSVAVRYPWRRKHVGFIIVHASLVSLIVIGFYTMFTKREGRIILQEGGRSASHMQMNKRWIQLLGTDNAGMPTVDAYGIVSEEGEVVLRRRDRTRAATVRVSDLWPNSEEVRRITDDAAFPRHAVEVALGQPPAFTQWMGEIGPEDLAADVGGLDIRVVPAGETWTPPDGPAEAVLATEAGETLPLPEIGEPIGETEWVLSDLRKYERAVVSETGGLTERPDGRINPAMLVMLTHADGSVERQLAFELAREEPFVVTIEGETSSGLRLTFRGPSFNQDTLAIMMDESGRSHAVFAPLGGGATELQHEGQWPWVLDLDGRPVSVLRAFRNAQPTTALEERPAADSSSPVAVVSTDNGPAYCRWNTAQEVVIGGEAMTLQYGPVTLALPFTMQLLDFRKMDYPGSDMAMAFESDVLVTPDGGQTQEFKIHMNHPYKQDGWKVYQSSFLGDNVTVLQVTKDPGLIPTYIACTGLVLGIFVTFYSRSLSWGHPEIPVPFRKQRGRQPAPDGAPPPTAASPPPATPEASRNGRHAPESRPAENPTETLADQPA